MMVDTEEVQDGEGQLGGDQHADCNLKGDRPSFLALGTVVLLG